MPVNINLGKWGSVFAVPSCIVDEHIKLASPAQLKVILFLLRNSDKSYTIEEISDYLVIHKTDVADSIQYWIDMGVLSESEGVLTPAEGQPAEPVTDEPVSEQPKPIHRVSTRPLKPDHGTVSARMANDENFGFLLGEVEGALNKPLSSGDQATILMLYDTCGLPAEVIVMLVNYCVSIGKGNVRTIDRLGVKWADEGIDTIEAADEIIARARQSSLNWSNVRTVFGLSSNGSPTSKQLEFAERWMGQWHFSDEMLRTAYEICVDRTGKMQMSYINKILERWHNAGIATPEDIEKRDKKPANNSSAGNQPSKSPKAAYDINELEKIT